jgi:hypothetical protein
MAVGEKREPMTPVHLVSHGTTMMLGEEHWSAKYWEKCGDEALAHGIEHIVMMVSPRRPFFFFFFFFLALLSLPANSPQHCIEMSLVDLMIALLVDSATDD